MSSRNPKSALISDATGSIYARLIKQNFVAYATSKAALARMDPCHRSRSWLKVRINSIETTAFETEMLMAKFEGRPDLYAQLENCYYQQRVGGPEEVACLALAIAGNAFDFMHVARIAQDVWINRRLFDPHCIGRGKT